MSPTVPLYQSETAPKWIRGFIVGSYQFAITVGLLLASVINNATHNHNDSGSYRIPIAVQFAWSIIIVVGMLVLPETPRYLVKQGNNKAAACSLSRLRRLPEDHDAVRQELSDIQTNHQYEASLGESGYIDCFRGNLLKRLATGCCLQGLQQLTGINFIIYYGTQFFKNSGFKNEFIITLIINCVNVGSTIPGLYAIDKWGRRPVLLLGAVGMAVSQLIVAVLGTTTTGQDSQGTIIVYNFAAQKAAIAFICIFIFFFAASWGPIAWYIFFFFFFFHSRSLMNKQGCHRRDIPPQSPRKVALHDNRHKLAVELGAELLNSVPGQLWQRQREPAVEDLLHLVWVLLRLHRFCVLYDLRDERVDTGGGR